MGKAGTKHFNQRKIDLPAFPLGLDWSQPPEVILDGALTDAKNCEYNHVSGALRTVPGVSVKVDYGEDDYIYYDNTNIYADTTTFIYTFGLTVTSLYYDRVHDIWLFTTATKLYKTNLEIVTEIGTLTGQEKPCFCLFGTDVLIASGGQIQKYDGTNLTTITDSPLSTYVTDRKGRVLAWNKASDVLNYSGVGDATKWTNVPDNQSSSQFIDVGYKDAGPIASIDMVADDIIVYKQSRRIYRVINEYPNWIVKELSRIADCINDHCALSVGNSAFFFGKQGFKSLATVVEYGDIKQVDAGQTINSRLSVDSTAHMWLVEPKKQIWIRPQNSTRVYIYHYTLNAFTYRDLKYVLTDVVVKDNEVYLSYGNKIGLLDEKIDRDDGEQIVTVIKSKVYLPQKLYTILKYTKIYAENLVTGSGVIELGETKIPLVINSSSQPIYGNKNPIYQNHTPIKGSNFLTTYEYGGGANESLQATITIINGAIEVRSLNLEVSEV